MIFLPGSFKLYFTIYFGLFRLNFLKTTEAIRHQTFQAVKGKVKISINVIKINKLKDKYKSCYETKQFLIKRMAYYLFN